MERRKPFPLVQDPVIRDLVLVGVFVIVCAYLSAAFDLVEVLFHFSRDHEDWELDEALLAALFSPIGIAWFAYRRRAAERRESLERGRAERHRDALQEQFGQIQRMETVMRLSGKIARDFEALNRSLNEDIQSAIRNMDNRPALQRSLLSVADAADRTTGLTRQLLMFSEKKIMDRYEISVGALLAGVQSRLMSVLDPKYSVEYQVENGEAAIRTDGDEFCQAMVNLVINACDAMPDGGTIAISARATADRVDFLIKDTGRGMDPETASHAFEPFFTTKKRGAGHGLGLTMVYGFVLACGGQIDLSSASGRGTTVRLSFPLAQRPAKDESPCSAAAVA